MTKICLRTGFFVVITAMLLAIPGMAAPICAGTGTFQDLLDTNALGGCTISPVGGGLLTFSNFTFTPAGAGTPSAAQTGYTLDNPGISIGTGQSIYGFEFNPGLAVIGSGGTPNAIQDILLTYTIVATGRTITSVHLLENAAVSGAGTAHVTEVMTFCTAADPDPALGTCHLFPGSLTVSTAGGIGLHNDLLGLGNWTSMTVSKDINAASGTLGSFATISQVRNAVDLNDTGVPEPATYGMMALGFLAFSYIARRRRR